MRFATGLFAVVLLLLVLRDAFETIVLPRRVQREFRLTRLFYLTTWPLWRGVANRVPSRFREYVLGWFGPFSLLLLLALWAVSIVFAFGLLHWAAGSALTPDGTTARLLADLYYSGTTFVTLGLGDLAPQADFARVLTVLEAGLGFAFLAITIGYLPVIYQSFSRREIAISMLDARAGSPPSAGELLLRHQGDPERRQLTQLLADWERWSAEVLESHLSYPVLAYFRSQHWNQSWLAALTMVLDTSAIVMECCEGPCAWQARLTFGMARHAAVDLAQVFRVRRPVGLEDRLPDATFTQLAEQVERAGMRFSHSDARIRIARARALYEPYAKALADYLLLVLPPWIRESSRPDNWESAPWKPELPEGPEHFYSAR